MQKNNVVYRKALPSDDVEKIAILLHLTDPYIYPSICQSPSDPFWRRFILFCMQAPTNIFSLQNLFVAERDEEIVGVLCAIPCGTKITFLEDVPLGEKGMAMLQQANDGYFRPLIEESKALNGYNVTNLCVDKGCRGQGVGEGLLCFYVNQVSHAPIYLDVIADNAAAVKLYQKCGFTVQKEYYGFSGGEALLPCLQMLKK